MYTLFIHVVKADCDALAGQTRDILDGRMYFALKVGCAALLWQTVPPPRADCTALLGQAESLTVILNINPQLTTADKSKPVFVLGNYSYQ